MLLLVCVAISPHHIIRGVFRGIVAKVAKPSQEISADLVLHKDFRPHPRNDSVNEGHGTHSTAQLSLSTTHQKLFPA